MKRNPIRSGVITTLFIFLVVIFYIQFLGLTGNSVNTENVDLPQGLHPMVSERANLLVQQAKESGIEIIITDDFRSIEEQNELYEKGRKDEGAIVTHAQGGESLHNFGLAIDFAILTNDGGAIWDMTYDGNNNGVSDWMEVVGFAKDLGFEWGGDWKNFKDYPHLQMDFGLSIRQLQRGEHPPEQSLNASNG